jgi:hypothetical protein
MANKDERNIKIVPKDAVVKGPTKKVPATKLPSDCAG